MAKRSDEQTTEATQQYATPKNNRVGVLFALAAGLSFACGNLFSVKLTEKVGMKALIYQSYGFLSMWLIYRLIKLVERCRKREQVV